jgi:hypothetical protein
MIRLHMLSGATIRKFRTYTIVLRKISTSMKYVIKHFLENIKEKIFGVKKIIIFAPQMTKERE